MQHPQARRALEGLRRRRCRPLEDDCSGVLEREHGYESVHRLAGIRQSASGLCVDGVYPTAVLSCRSEQQQFMHELPRNAIYADAGGPRVALQNAPALSSVHRGTSAAQLLLTGLGRERWHLTHLNYSGQRSRAPIVFQSAGGHRPGCRPLDRDRAGPRALATARRRTTP